MAELNLKSAVPAERVPPHTEADNTMQAKIATTKKKQNEDGFTTPNKIQNLEPTEQEQKHSMRQKKTFAPHTAPSTSKKTTDNHYRYGLSINKVHPTTHYIR